MRTFRSQISGTLYILWIWLSLVVVVLAAVGASNSHGLSSSNGPSERKTSDRIEEALFTLSQTPTGELLIRKAAKLWKIEGYSDLRDNFKWGYSSRTDTVFTRHFNPVSGQEDRERLVTIYLRQDQTIPEIVLDMAHELAHATSQMGFDPYDANLTVGKYILSAIEGPGGEVEAVTSECEVALQLSATQARERIEAKRCLNYLISQNAPHADRIDPTKIRRDFYRVGQWLQQVVTQLGTESSQFPFLSSSAPVLFSSTGRAPYPVTLIREYEEMTQAACKNSKNRILSLAKWDATPQGIDPVQTIQRFIHQRCQ